MTEEEKKAIKSIKKFARYKDSMSAVSASEMNIILNLVEKQAKQIEGYQDKIDKAIDELSHHIGCCKSEILESGSDYIHNQYWSMFLDFNKHVIKILKEE